MWYKHVWPEVSMSILQTTSSINGERSAAAVSIQIIIIFMFVFIGDIGHKKLAGWRILRPRD